jgi:hypothetical protein
MKRGPTESLSSPHSEQQQPPCSNIGIRTADGSLEFKTDGKMRRKAVKFNPSRSPRRQALFTDLGLLETVVHEEIEASTFKSSSQPLRGMRKIEGDRQV